MLKPSCTPYPVTPGEGERPYLYVNDAAKMLQTLTDEVHTKTSTFNTYSDKLTSLQDQAAEAKAAVKQAQKIVSKVKSNECNKMIGDFQDLADAASDLVDSVEHWLEQHMCTIADLAFQAGKAAIEAVVEATFGEVLEVWEDNPLCLPITKYPDGKEKEAAMLEMCNVVFMAKAAIDGAAASAKYAVSYPTGMQHLADCANEVADLLSDVLKQQNSTPVLKEAGETELYLAKTITGMACGNFAGEMFQLVEDLQMCRSEMYGNKCGTMLGTPKGVCAFADLINVNPVPKADTTHGAGV